MKILRDDIKLRKKDWDDVHAIHSGYTSGAALLISSARSNAGVWLREAGPMWYSSLLLMAADRISVPDDYDEVALYTYVTSSANIISSANIDVVPYISDILALLDKIQGWFGNPPTDRNALLWETKPLVDGADLINLLSVHGIARGPAVAKVN